MRQESESIHSIRGGILGQGERFTSTGGPQEGAVEETVVLLGCKILGAMGMCWSSRVGKGGGHPS